ncbi:hypothetical protein PORY_000082 [Pneumocystis oryctolagi]|uniref:Uncharacterized protein n=1 Tax=Pneumocystis oryctolagi TaxID=42067 RepID=A0ACB7CJ85_9ASCO|nr:hypothetical protein PORY_000082 [Pneumocystis oryctolagi]
MGDYLNSLTSLAQSTYGDVPPPLVGCSFTVIGAKLYVFAGRLVSNWCLTNDLYVLDLESYIWTKIQGTSSCAPEPRYFHSADIYLNSIYIFGGIGLSKNPDNQHCVLDDIAVFDIQFGKWKKIPVVPSLHTPKPRYAHLSVVSMNYLMIIGGQDLDNNYIEETSYFDMDTCLWIHTFPFNKHCGLYRSVALCKIETYPECALNLVEKNLSTQETPSSQGSFFPCKRKSMSVSESSKRLSNYSESINPLQHSRTRKSVDITHSSDTEFTPFYRQHIADNPVYIYSNYNFKDVKNELYVITFSHDDQFNITDISDELNGESKPPALRFPSGGILGNHLVVFGTYLTNTSHSYSIWCIDLNNLTWSKIDPGPLLNEGSWNKGVIDYDKNCLLIFGNKERNLIEDYNNRRINFDHIVLVELEAFGIYRITIPELSPMAQELGLMMLENPSFADMEMLTQDNIVLPCSTKILSTRWPRFHGFLKASLKKDSTEFSTFDFLTKSRRNSLSVYSNISQASGGGSSSARFFNRSRTLYIPHPYSVVHQFLRFLYTYSLEPSMLSDIPALFALLSLSKSFGPDLEVKDLSLYIFYALQKCLTLETAPRIYEMAVLYGHRGLQIRALRLMSMKKKEEINFFPHSWFYKMSSCENRRKWIVFSYWIFVFLAIPIWWKTTEIHRAKLPLKLMNNWEKGQECDIEFDIPIIIDIYDSYDAKVMLEKLKKMISIKQEKNIMKLNIKEKHLNTDKSHYIVKLREERSIESTSMNIYHNRTLFIDYNPHIFQELPKIVSETLLDIFSLQEKYIRFYLKKNHFQHKSSELDEETYTKIVKYSSSFDIVFSLINGDEKNVASSWDIKNAIYLYFGPLLKQLSALSEFNIESQVQFCAKLTFDLYKSDHGPFQIFMSQLPEFVNFIEWNLATTLSSRKIINFVVYIPPHNVQPLFLKDLRDNLTTTNSFLVPQWGSIIIYNQNCRHTNISNINTIQLQPIFHIFVSNFLSLLGAPPLPSYINTEPLPFLNEWRLDGLYRQRIIENIVSASATLGSLARLVEKIHNMAVPDEVQENVFKTINHLKKTCRHLKSFQFLDALKDSNSSVNFAEKAFFDPSMFLIKD